VYFYQRKNFFDSNFILLKSTADHFSDNDNEGPYRLMVDKSILKGNNNNTAVSQANKRAERHILNRSGMNLYLILTVFKDGVY
jgi:hypothetical protein